jgi:hypothetical protein
MGFEKKNISSRSEKVDFFERSVFSRTATKIKHNEKIYLNAIFTNLFSKNRF